MRHEPHQSGNHAKKAVRKLTASYILRHALGDLAQNKLLEPRIQKKEQGKDELPLFDLFESEHPIRDDHQ